MVVPGRHPAARDRGREMAARIMAEGMTLTDRLVAWAMMSGLTFALVQSAQGMALPAHFA